jgi:hypothetical protein
MGEDILNLENKPENIELLAAQKQLYIIAKRVFAVQIFFTAIVVVLLSIINQFTDIGKLISIYSIVIAFVDLLLIKDLIKNYKEKAARIQEQFDTTVLSITKNSLIEIVNPEYIFRYAKKHKRIDLFYSKLKDWYSTSIKDIDSPIAKIICQRSNFVYDFTLRKNYNLILSIIIGFLSLVIVSLAAIKESNIADFFLTGLLPILPIFMLFINLVKENSSSIRNLDKLKQVADDCWTRVLGNEQLDVDAIGRRLQDSIYQNRINSPLIFEWFYNFKRKQLEEEMYYSVDRLVNDYKATNA